MVNGIEVTFQVAIYYDSVAFLIILFGSFNGLVGTSAFSKTIAMVREMGVNNRLDDLKYRLLDNPVQDTRYTEISF